MKLLSLLVGFLLSFSLHADSTDMQNLLSSTLNEQVSNNKIVSMAVGLKVNGKLVAEAVQGERILKSGNLAGLQDKWHIGSVTKSFTSTMLARLVEKDVLSWDTKISEVFTEFEEIHPGWQDVNLHQLLTHTSGAPANFPLLSNLEFPSEGTERSKARKKAVQHILQKAPKHEAGSQFLYSNVGYTIAGLMAAVTTGKTWENLVREEIFTPLNLKSGGFGPPQDSGSIVEQPRGHRKSLFGGKKAMPANADNSPIMGPAGIIHLSLNDLATYVEEHRKGDLGESEYLKPMTFKQLHKSELDDYAYGWVIYQNREWAQGPVIWHNGSNTMWYTIVAYIPNLNMSIAIVSNDGDIQKVESSALSITKIMAEKIAAVNLK